MRFGFVQLDRRELSVLFTARVSRHELNDEIVLHRGSLQDSCHGLCLPSRAFRLDIHLGLNRYSQSWITGHRDISERLYLLAGIDRQVFWYRDLELPMGSTAVKGHRGDTQYEPGDENR